MKYLVLALAGASTMLSSAASKAVDTQILDKSESKWQYSHVRAIDENGLTNVVGSIKAKRHFTLPRGHVDIAAFSKDGQLILEATTPLKVKKKTIVNRLPKDNFGNRFSANLNVKLPSDALVKIVFHTREMQDREQSTHQSLITH